MRKAEREVTERANAESSSKMPFKKDKDEWKKPVGRKFFSSRKGESEDKSEQQKAEDDMLTDNFDTDSEPSLDITCNVVSMLPREYDQVMEVEEPEDTIEAEMARHRPACYVMNNGRTKSKMPFWKGKMKP